MSDDAYVGLWEDADENAVVSEPVSSADAQEGSS